MFGLDEWIAGFSDGASVFLVVLVAVLLGLRHALDPDHVAAMTTLIAGGREPAGRAAALLGLRGAWATARRFLHSDCPSCSSAPTCPTNCSAPLRHWSES
jgi:hypothetical protein